MKPLRMAEDLAWRLFRCVRNVDNQIAVKTIEIGPSAETVGTNGAEFYVVADTDVPG